MVFAKSMKHKKLKKHWFLQNHENIKNGTYLLPAVMPGNNSEPKTWENIRLKSSNSRLWYQHARNTGICFVRKSSCIHMKWKHLLAKNREFVGQVETQKDSEVCSSDFNNACRVFGADLSIEICSNNFVGEED